MDVELDASSSSEQPSNVYKVLGHTTFADVKKINVTPKWITAGQRFSSDLSKKKLTKLSKISGLHPELAKRVEERIKRWFPVQAAVLPRLINETIRCPVMIPRDLIICAPTGSGKTLSYVIPILNALSSGNTNQLYALIVAPVQNLVRQIEKEIMAYNVSSTLNVISLCGANSFEHERKYLAKACIAIATPGRLLEHLADLDRIADFSCIRLLVVDEADRMSHVARIEWLDALERNVHYSHNCSCADDLFRGSRMQKILLSATLSLDVEELSEWRLRHPFLFRATKDELLNNTQSHQNINEVITPDSLMTKLIVCEPKLKPLAIYDYLGKAIWSKSLIFVNSKLASYRLALLLKLLCDNKYTIEELSSNLYGKRRQKVLNRFKKGTTCILISSDVLSRGIDVPDIDLVINYDVPQNEKLLIHRVGRTARCGKIGTALTLTTHKEVQDTKKLLSKASLGDAIDEEEFKDVEDEKIQEKYRKSLINLKEELDSKTKANAKKNGKLRKPSKKKKNRT